MFFARFVVWADGFFPAHWKFTWRLRAMFNYFDCRKKVIAWHRAELEELDFNYALQQAGFRLVAARDKALTEGIGPLDQAYPSHPVPHIKFLTPRSIERRERERRYLEKVK